MVSLPSEEQIPFDSLDRLVRVKMRPKGMAAYSRISDFVYEAAKDKNPISMDIADALSPENPQKIGIFTGASSPDHYPNGENDGPLGAVVLWAAFMKSERSGRWMRHLMVSISTTSMSMLVLMAALLWRRISPTR